MVYKLMATKRTILLVEDEELLANILKQRLEKEGFNVVLARDGEEALNILKDAKPDLLLLDIILPKVSGFELMSKLQEDPRYAKVPIVVVSNLGQEGDIKKGEMLGAIGYFVKAHLSIEELVERVKKFLEESKKG